MKDILLIGGGGHCKAVIDVIEQEGRFKISGIVDKPELLNSNVLGYPVIGVDSDLRHLASRYKYALITVGQIKSSSLRVKLFDLAVKSGFSLPSIVSPSSYVSKHSVIGKGVVIMHNAMVNANVLIGDNCIVNSKALIEHDSSILKHCHISTSVTINGGVTMEAGCFVGSGTVVKESITITEGSFIKIGSVVT